MKYLVQICLVLGIAVTFTLFVTPEPAQAQPVPDCIDSDDSRAQNTAAWWGRRTAEEKRLITDLECQERFIPMVCIFLWEPDLRACTNKGVAEYRADKACSAKGHALLSEAHVACKEDFKRTFSPPFAGSTS
ncbi:MAG: hypothetical protein CVT72_10040 [Alphaproteobacteria bacterium HGW-Alphaproteobacteria-11]|nr:MAG: hypothetical protein CVT72_10040 [Alphaproteobacteria bacterium HGW-Alphaproteobacteria-11]